MAALTDTLVLDHGAAGNLRRIEELLMLLWTPAGEGDSTSVRACMGNLIVYLEREDDRNDIEYIIHEVVRARPSRVILMFAYPDLPDEPVQVSVSAHCWLEEHGGERVCSEQIRIRATGRRIQDLPGIVVPLLVSDVPVHLWWRDRFLEHQDIFEKFIDSIDHVIYEGLHWKKLPEKVARIEELMKRLQGRVAVTNFNWSRLLPWQQRIAQFFDHGLYDRELDNLCRVSIEYHTPPQQTEGRFFQALLLSGWLASQLGWKLRGGSREGNRVHYQLHAKDGRDIRISIGHKEMPSPGTKGIQKLRFEFEHRGASFAFGIDRDQENQMLFLQVNKEGACGLAQKVRHVSASFATLVLRGMENYQSSSMVFERAFANAAAMLTAVS